MPALDGPAPWGRASIALRLPVCDLAITGLSTAQRAVIAHEYGSFAAGERAAGAAQVLCRAGRLAAPLCIPAAELTRAGQYAPRQVRDGTGLSITGANFTARVPLEPPAKDLAEAPVAQLCVAREEELPQPAVLENFLRILLAHQVQRVGGMLLHSAGLVVDGRVLLFVGASNTGKTTLSRKALAGGARVLSDDINLVLPAAGSYAVHDVPLSGELRRRCTPRPGSLALAGLLLLEQGRRLSAVPVGAAAAVAVLFAQSPFANADEQETEGLLNALARLVAHTPVARLTVALDDPFHVIIHEIERAFVYV